MKKSLFLLVSLLIMATLLVACGGTATTPAPEKSEPAKEEAQATEAPKEETEAPKEEAAASGDVVEIRWFVGLGTGGNPPQIEAQNAIVKKFNDTHKDIKLTIEIVQTNVAFDTLSTQIASGTPPDIIGPVGVKGSNAFSGLWLDLEPLVKETNYDLTPYEKATVDFYRVPGEGLIGLPFGVFPSFIFFNRDLFDEAGLKYPPTKYGEPYADGEPWTVEKMAELAEKLTVDEKGNDATSPDFNSEKIVQFGYVPQFTDVRGASTLFGAGNFVDDKGKAIVPDHWRTALKFYYDGMWTKHFIPTDSYINSDLLGNGNPFGSGNVAMANIHLWYTCCVGDVKNWDIAPVPSYNGKTTAKLHADTFRLMKASKHPKEAFTVLSYLLNEASNDLLTVYGGMPANKSEQKAFLDTLDKTYTQKVNWQVAIDSLAYPDNPSHEGNMPNFNKADERVAAFTSLYQGTPDLDIDKELDKLQQDLQGIFDAKK